MYRTRLAKVPKVGSAPRLARLGLTHSTDLVKTSTSVRRISTSHENSSFSASFPPGSIGPSSYRLRLSCYDPRPPIYLHQDRY